MTTLHCRVCGEAKTPAEMVPGKSHNTVTARDHLSICRDCKSRQAREAVNLRHGNTKRSVTLGFIAEPGYDREQHGRDIRRILRERYDASHARQKALPVNETSVSGQGD